MSGELVEAVMRLLECLKFPLDSRVLGRPTVLEIPVHSTRSRQFQFRDLNGE
jgi:hypothetical protein